MLAVALYWTLCYGPLYGPLTGYYGPVTDFTDEFTASAQTLYRPVR
jgi:hypothetical protein